MALLYGKKYFLEIIFFFRKRKPKKYLRYNHLLTLLVHITQVIIIACVKEKKLKKNLNYFILCSMFRDKASDFWENPFFFCKKEVETYRENFFY